MKPTAEVLQFGKAAIVDLDSRMERMQAEYAVLQAERTAWTVILGPPEGEPATETAKVEDGITSGEERSVADPTVAARQIINSMSEKGMKPKDVTAKLAAIQLLVGTGFSSNLLFRMKKKGEVIERGGRYYLPKIDPIARLYAGHTKDQGTAEAVP